MEIVTTVKEVRDRVKAWKKEGKQVGLVPTMGYLHEGHKSLIDKAVAENDAVVVSVFVNPMQFGPTEDLESYPRDFEHDCALLEQNGVDLVLTIKKTAPDVEVILLTAHGNIPDGVQAIKNVAFDFIT